MSPPTGWARASFSSLVGRAAQQEGGLLNGSDPTQFNTSDPIRLFIVQLGVIILMAQLLSVFLGRIRQPKVIAEVLGGIILGPTAMGRIPGFTEHVFPEPSRPYLSLVANIGLVLFLFLVGLEIDLAVIKRNARTSMTISAGGILLPFAIGAGVAVPVYKTFIDPEASSFGHFLPQFLGTRRRLISVAGRGKRLAVESHREEIKQVVEEVGADRSVAAELRKTAGDVAAALLVSAVQGPMVVLQAAYVSADE